MTRADFEAFIMGLPNVQKEDNFGYAFFFVGDDRRLPFVTIADSDNAFDNVSNLNREGVFRLNIGVGKETFRGLTASLKDEDIDYTALNVFFPHPHYAKQHVVCILNPEGDNVEKTKRLIEEAHSIAAGRAK